MGGYSAIPLQVTQPNIEGPLQLAQQGMGLQSLAQGIQLGQQRLQEAKLQAQQLEAAKEANQTINDAFTANKGDYDSTRQAIIGKVPLQFVQKFDQDHMENVQAAQRKQSGDLLLEAAKDGKIVSLMEGLDAVPDDQKPDFYQKQVLPALNKIGSADGWPGSIPSDGSFNSQIKATAAAHNYKGQLYTDAQKKQRAEQEAAAAARATAQAASVAATEAEANKQRLLEAAARAHRVVDALPPAQQQAAHEAWLKNLDPSIAPVYQGLETYTPAAAAAIQKIPLNAAQVQTGATNEERAKTAADRAADTARYNSDRIEQMSRTNDIRDKLEGVSQQLANLKQNAPPKPLNATARSALVESLAETAIKNSVAGGAKSFAEIIRDVQDPNNYADENTNAPEMDAHRGAVASKLMQWQGQGMTLQQKQLQMNKLQQNIDTKNAPDYLTTLNWMKKQGGAWAPNGVQDPSKIEDAKQEIMRQRSQAKTNPANPVVDPKAGQTVNQPPPRKPAEQAAAGAATPPKGTVATVVDPSGKPHYFTSQGAADAFKKALAATK